MMMSFVKTIGKGASFKCYNKLLFLQKSFPYYSNNIFLLFKYLPLSVTCTLSCIWHLPGKGKKQICKTSNHSTSNLFSIVFLMPHKLA